MFHIEFIYCLWNAYHSLAWIIAWLKLTPKIHLETSLLKSYFSSQELYMLSAI